MVAARQCGADLRWTLVVIWVASMAGTWAPECIEVEGPATTPRWGQLDIVEAIFAQQAAPPALSLQSAATSRPVRIRSQTSHQSQIQDPVSDDPGSECPLLQNRPVVM